MAVDLSKLAVRRKIELRELNGKSVAIDAFNVLYQFLSIIRQPDGMPLTDKDGNVTSHLSGLFYRTIDLIGNGILPIYVFDGIPSILKQKTIAARMRRRKDAHSAWDLAVKEGRLEEARTYAQASTSVNKEIVTSAKELLGLMGIYCISAPSEGEAQASSMCRHGQVYAVGSQDYDTLLLGAPLVVRNMTLSGKRKLPNRNVYVSVEPELVSLGETLDNLKITQEQLIWIGIMLGTDFNDGIKGVGPKTALKIAKSSSSISEIASYVRSKYKSEFELDPNEIMAMFKNPEVKEITRAELEAGLRQKPDKGGLIEFMCDRHGFSKERIGKYADMLVKMRGSARQQSMDSWFKK